MGRRRTSMSSILGRSKNQLPGEPDEYIALLEPSKKQVLLEFVALDETPRVDASFPRLLQNDLVPLLSATTSVATDATTKVEGESDAEQAELHIQSRKVIRIWPILELAAAALLIFAFAGIFLGTDQ